MSSRVDDTRHPIAGRGAPRRRAWLGPVALAGVVVAGCAAVALSDDAAELVPACPFRSLTGLDCPLCGGTRAVRALGAGHLGRALGSNLLVVLAVPLVLLAWARWLDREVRPGRERRSAPGWLLPAAVVAAVAFTVARNLDVAGLSWMASGG